MPESTLTTLTSKTYRTFQHTAIHSPEGLCSAPTTNVRSQQYRLIDCDTDEIPPRDLQSRFEDALQDMRLSVTGATIDYLQLGGRYFDISSKTRSLTPPTNPAQMQYGIESRPWHADPFFTSWLQVLHAIVDLETTLSSGPLAADLPDWICEEVTKAQTMVENFLITMRSVEEGVESMEDAERMHAFEDRIMNCARARAIEREERGLSLAKREIRRLCRQKKAREASHEAERRHLPRMAFEQAIFEKWQRRVEGIEKLQDIKAPV